MQYKWFAYLDFEELKCSMILLLKTDSIVGCMISYLLTYKFPMIYTIYAYLDQNSHLTMKKKT